MLLIGYITFITHNFAQERRELIKAVMSKDVKEFVEVTAKEEEKEEEPQRPPDLVSEAELSDEDFEKVLKGETLDGGQNL